MVIVRCARCDYWDPKAVKDQGMCKRYPAEVPKNAANWCGEGRTQEAGVESVFRDLDEPIYDIEMTPEEAAGVRVVLKMGP